MNFLLAAPISDSCSHSLLTFALLLFDLRRTLVIHVGIVIDCKLEPLWQS